MNSLKEDTAKKPISFFKKQQRSSARKAILFRHWSVAALTGARTA